MILHKMWGWKDVMDILQDYRIFNWGSGSDK